MKSLYTLIFTLAIVSCGGESERTILYNKVMDIHDEMMPKMDDMYKLKTDLQGKLATATSPEEKTALEQRIAKLDSADQKMMDWMHQFNPPADDANEDEALTYLKDQLVKVAEMKKAVVDALDQK